MSIGSAGLCPAVSCPTWHHCVSLWQETFRKQFPVRLDTIAFLSDRKLFASSFLSGLTPLRFTPTGNFSQAVFLTPWLLCASPQQETPLSCEIVKKNIGYTFPHVFRVPKRGFHSYIDFFLSIGHGQGMDSVFWLYPPFFFSFYKIWFSWHFLDIIFSLFFLLLLFSVKSQFTIFLPVDKWISPKIPMVSFVIFLFPPFRPCLFTVIHKFLCISPVDTFLFPANCLYVWFSFRGYEQHVNNSVKK